MRSILFVIAAVVSYPATAIETQWKLDQAPMESYIANGYQLVQAFPKEEQYSIQWIYLLQKDTSVVRCSERAIFNPQRSAFVRNDLICQRLVTPFEEK